MAKESKKWTERTDYDIEGWWSPEDMAVIQGRVLDGKVIDGNDDNPRLIWIVQLSEPCLCHESGEKEAREYPKGAIVGMGHRAKLEPILKLFRTHTGFEVRVSPTQKKNIGRGRTMWLFRVATTGGRPRDAVYELEAPKSDMKALPPANRHDNVEEGDYEPTEDIPF